MLHIPTVAGTQSVQAYGGHDTVLLRAEHAKRSIFIHCASRTGVSSACFLKGPHKGTGPKAINALAQGRLNR